MRHHVLGASILIGSVLMGCGVHTAPPGLAPVAPVRAVAKATAGVLGAKKVLMPPLQVFKTAEDETRGYLRLLKERKEITWAVVSPLTNTIQITVDGAKAGYLVSLHGNALVNTPEGGRQKAFLYTYLIDTKGKLSFSSFMGATRTTGRDQEKPVTTFSKDTGDIYLTMPWDGPGNLPPEVEAYFNPVHEKERQVFAARFPELKLFPADPRWWNFMTAEIRYKDRMIGYFSDPGAWMWQDTETFDCRKGVSAINLLQPTGERVLSDGFTIDPGNPVGYRNFPL